MNYLDGKHYIITLLFSKDNYTEDIIKHYIISDNNPLQNKEINKYLNDYLLSKMKETYIDLDNYLKPVYQFIKESFMDLPLEIDIEQLFNQRQLTKLYPYTIIDDSETIVEKVFNYTRIMREFSISDFFIFVNLKQYLTDDDYELFSNYVLNEKINVLLIENEVISRLPTDKYLIIDNDLCEIV